MRVLILEDDFLQGDVTSQAIKREFPEAKIILISTESEFRDQFESIASDPPNVAIIDLKLPWQDLGSERRQPSPEVLREGNRLAGIRCQRILASDPRTQSMPTIIYSALATADIELALEGAKHNTKILTKAGGSQELLSMLDSVLEGEGKETSRDDPSRGEQSEQEAIESATRPQPVPTLALYFDLDLLSTNDITDILNTLEEAFGDELKILRTRPLPPGTEIARLKPRKAA